MGVLPPIPDPPIYRAFTIYPSVPSPSPSPDSKPSWTTPLVRESNFPQSSLISELSSLQDKDKSSIADKIARLSTEQRGAVYNVLVDLVGEGDSGASTVDAEGQKLEWSVCEATRVKDEKRKGRTRCVRAFFVRAPVELNEREYSRKGSEVSTRTEVRGKELELRGKEVEKKWKGKGKEIEKGSRSRSRGKEKATDESYKERRRSTKERERRESKGKGKEIERVEERKSRRRTTRSRQRKPEPLEEDSDDCSCDSDSTVSIQSRNLRRTRQRPLSQRFKPKHSEVNPMAYGRAEQPRWEKPVIIPPQYSIREYQPAPPNEYHIRAAYEAGQRDAMAERMRNAALQRGSVPQGPSHVISFERLRPGFEEWSETYSQGSQEPERYVSDRRQPRAQYPRPVNPNHIPPSYVGTQYGQDAYMDDRHIGRRYSEDIRMDSSYERYGPDTLRRRYTAW